MLRGTCGRCKAAPFHVSGSVGTEVSANRPTDSGKPHPSGNLCQLLHVPDRLARQGLPSGNGEEALRTIGHLICSLPGSRRATQFRANGSRTPRQPSAEPRSGGQPWFLLTRWVWESPSVQRRSNATRSRCGSTEGETHHSRKRRSPEPGDDRKKDNSPRPVESCVRTDADV